MRRSHVVPSYVVSTVAAAVALVASSALPSPLPLSEKPAPRFVHLGLDDGLSQSSVSAIVQDQHGLLWFGTQDGLNRWDGHEFTVFRPGSDSHGFGATTVTSLAVGADGTVWIGTFGRGLWAHRPSTQEFVHVRLVNDSRPVHVRAVTEAANGTVVIGTRSGLVTRDGDGNVQRHVPPSGRADSIQAVAVDRQNRIWAAARNQLYIMEAGSAEVTAGPTLPPSPVSSAPSRITSLTLDASGVLWIGASSGVWRLHLDDDQLRAVPSLQGRPVGALELDSAGRLWVAVRADGLVVYDPESQSTIELRHDGDDPSSLATSFVTALFEDRFGVMWVGVEGHGVSVHDPARPPFAHIRPGSNGLGGHIVRAIATGAHGELWVGTADAGLDHLSPSGNLVTRYRNDPEDPTSLSSDAVWTLLVDSSSQLWVGTRGGGLNRLDRQTGSFHRYGSEPDLSSGPSSTVVLSLLETAAGTLLIGTAAGLDRYDRGTDSFRCVPLADEPPAIRSLAEGPPGTVWVGTSGGLLRLDERTERVLPVIPEIDNTSVLEPTLAVHWSSQQAVWIGTQQGVVRYQPATGTWQKFDSSHGLPNDVIYGILEDATGHHWLSSNKGLTRIRLPPVNDGGELEVRSFDRSDGLQGTEFNGGAVHACDGTFFFGGINGLTVFRPAQIPPPRDPPPVTLLAANLHSAEGTARRPLFGTDQLTLAPETRTVSFEFTALGSRAPDSSQYRYRLQGFDDQWIPVGEHRFATYTNLDPARYTFQVQAGKDGRWTDPPAQLTVVVQPPWWQSYWAIGVYGLVLVLGGVVTDRVQRRRVVARERERSSLREAQLRAAAAEAQARIIESENRRKSDELEEARRLQLSMLPHELPHVAGFEIATRMVTATEVGGDYYDLQVDRERLAIAVGDATGHGLAAGTVVSVVKGVFSASVLTDPPARFLSRCNRILRRLRLHRLHMAMAVLHVHGSELTFATAGMPPLLVFRAGSESIEEAFTPGLPLGALEQAAYAEGTLELSEGDTVLAVTDGLPETLSPDGEPLGYTRLKTAFQSFAQQAPAAVADAALAIGRSWRGPSSQQDDLTVLVLRRLGSP
jgi:ligand-binding sensor domain-containing protein/serine phosphatase RsbU (regulator of sigma subunit)